MASVKCLPPSLPVAEELAPERGLPEPLACDGHRAPVSFEEEERTPPVLRCIIELEAEDPIGLHAQAVRLAAMADFHLPAEWKAQAPG